MILGKTPFFFSSVQVYFTNSSQFLVLLINISITNFETFLDSLCIIYLCYFALELAIHIFQLNKTQLNLNLCSLLHQTAPALFAKCGHNEETLFPYTLKYQNCGSLGTDNEMLLEVSDLYMLWGLLSSGYLLKRVFQ